MSITISLTTHAKGIIITTIMRFSNRIWEKFQFVYRQEGVVRFPVAFVRNKYNQAVRPSQIELPMSYYSKELHPAFPHNFVQQRCLCHGTRYGSQTCPCANGIKI